MARQRKRKNQTLAKTNVPCLYRSKRSDIFYAIFTRLGGQIKRSLKTTDKELARRRLEDLRQKVARLNSKDGNTLPFAELDTSRKLCGGLACRWLQMASGRMKPSSLRRRMTAIYQLAKHFPKTVRSISKTDVEAWAACRAKQTAARTFNIERETLIQILDYGVREGLLLENPARVISRRKQPKAEVVIPSKQQFKVLLDILRSSDARYHEAANLVEFLAYSGCRLGEATAMRWGNVNFDLNSFTVTGGEQGTKNYESRTVPMFPALEDFLRQLHDTLPSPPSQADFIFSIDSAKKALATCCRKAGLPSFTHHSLRHFFCSNAIEAGVDFKAIAGWLGHKDGGLLVARTYGHLRDEHSAAMAKRMTFSAAESEESLKNIVAFSPAAGS